MILGSRISWGMLFSSISIVFLVCFCKSEGISKIRESFDYSGIDKTPGAMPAEIETSRNLKLSETLSEKKERSLRDDLREKRNLEDKTESEEKKWLENDEKRKAGNESDKKLGSLADRDFSEGPKMWDQWGKWSSCTVSCGVGKLKRWRYCITGGCSIGEREAQFKTCTFPACR